MRVSQKDILIDVNVDFEELFKFPKMVINDMFRQMREKGNGKGKIRIDIIYKEGDEE